MSIYTPDKWVVVRFTGEDGAALGHKVFATWHGGWAGNDSWQLNSGIVQAYQEGNYWCFEGYSGSVYRCHKNAYGTTTYGSAMLHRWKDRIAEASGGMEVLDGTGINWALFAFDR
jgi:hypothetical protein